MSKTPIMRVLLMFSIMLLPFVSMAQVPRPTAREVDMIGPYKLGAEYTTLKNLPGFKYDTGRSKPDKGIRVGKIIDKNVYDQATIQRLTFHRNKLVRISIIMGDPEFSEEQTKGLVAKQWGDPGPKQKAGNDMIYMWAGSTGTIMILPADGGRQMISLVDNDDSHYVQ